MPNERPFLTSESSTVAPFPWQGSGGKGYVINYVWNTNTLALEIQQQVTAGGAGTGLTDTQLRASAVPVLTTETAYATRVDEASSSVTYVAKAAVGTADSSALWQLQRITVSGTVTTIEFADSNANFDNTWTGRASAAYG